MKRKKWSELEERTLLNKYAELRNSGALSKLRTREKKFKPIAEHVNSVHHLQDPVTFPFTWSWRDVSVKVQNMRHQYLNVKQKIRISDDHFNWKDGEDHWENFLKYKQVFGDVELDTRDKKVIDDGDDDIDLFASVAVDDGMNEDDEEEVGINSEEDMVNDAGIGEKSDKGLGVLGTLCGRVLDLREGILRREEKRRVRDFSLEKDLMGREKVTRKDEWTSMRDEELESWELELEDREMMLAKKEANQRLRLDRELEEERRWRMRMEEKRQEEDMEWRERMVSLQIEHEKAMMQMHVDACQNQMQILMAMSRLICQFFGSPNDGMGGGLGVLTPQVLQNLQHPGGLGDSGKPDSSSPSEFL